MQEEPGSVGKSSPMFKKQDAPYSIRGEFRGDAQCTEDKRADWEGRQLDQTLEIHGDGNLPPAFMHALVREMLALHRQTNTISKNIKLQQPAMKIAGYNKSFYPALFRAVFTALRTTSLFEQFQRFDNSSNALIVSASTR